MGFWMGWDSPATRILARILTHFIDLKLGQLHLTKSYGSHAGKANEVPTLQLQDAIRGPSKNSNAVPRVDITFGDPEVELLRQSLNDLINALRR